MGSFLKSIGHLGVAMANKIRSKVVDSIPGHFSNFPVPYCKKINKVPWAKVKLIFSDFYNGDYDKSSHRLNPYSTNLLLFINLLR